MSTKYKIIALGGTGQMVLHYYLQLYLLGLISHPFDVVVIDTDEINDSVLRVQRLFRDLQYGTAPSEGLGVHLPTVETYRVAGFHAGSALERLTDLTDESATHSHPVRAYFDKETLAQNLKEGLFARPALSSVVSLGEISQHALAVENGATVVVVGSVIGGTGGGLMAAVIDTVRWKARAADANVSIRAVLFGMYFRPDPGRIGGDEQRFYSNEILVLRSIREALEQSELDRFVIVRRTGEGYDRRPELEKRAEHLPWPEPKDPRGGGHPFWVGAQALEYLLTDTTTQKFVRFEEREVRVYTPPVPLDKAMDQLNKGVQVSGRLVDRSIVKRMAREPWLTTVWGEALTRIYAHFWAIAIGAAGEQERVARFPVELQDALSAIWEGRKDRPGLRQFFPQLARSPRVRPRAFTRIPWPRGKHEIRSSELFSSLEACARRAAATLLFWSLREAK